MNSQQFRGTVNLSSQDHPTPGTSHKAENQYRKILKGFFSLTFAKLVFMVAGYVVYFSLPRLLSAAEFGNYGVVVGILNVFNMVLITGTIQAVSKFVSEEELRERAIRVSANRIQTIIGSAAFWILIGTAPFLAAFFKDPAVAPAIYAGSAVPLFYAFYAVTVGSLNGRKMFMHQASLDISFSILKTTGILTLAYLGFGVVGCFLGFSISACLILIIGVSIVVRYQHASAGEPFPVKKILTFEIWVMIITLINNLLISTDLFLVKSIISGSAAATQAGYYTAVQTFARIPYTLVIAVSLVIFPLISKSTFENDQRATQQYIQTSLRMTWLFVLPVAIIFSALPGEFLSLVYPDEYIQGSTALRLLPIGEALLALMFIAVTIITGSGRPLASIAINAVALVILGGLCFVFIPLSGIAGAALGASLGWLAGLVIAGIYIFRQFHAFIPSLTWIRTLAAGTVAYLSTFALPEGVIGKILSGSVVIPAVYFGVLFLLKELSRQEITRILTVLKK